MLNDFFSGHEIHSRRQEQGPDRLAMEYQVIDHVYVMFPINLIQ
jgi:hypothetical protein